MKTLKFCFIFYLLINNFVVAQTTCSKSKVTRFVIVEIMPVLKGTVQELEININNSINIEKYNIKEGLVFYISFLISCRGEVVEQKILKYHNELFNNAFIESFTKFAEWSPGYHRNRPVNVSNTLKCENINGKIQIKFDNRKNEKNKKQYKRFLKQMK